MRIHRTTSLLTFGRLRGRCMEILATPRKEPPVERVSVAVKCPTCEKIAETEIVGDMKIPQPLPREVTRLHADCDLQDLHNELSKAAISLSLYFS